MAIALDTGTAAVSTMAKQVTASLLVIWADL